MRPYPRRAVQYSAIFLRLALGAGFLSAVADRFGLWGAPGASGVAWGDFGHFLTYTAQLNPFLPASLIPAVGWVATAAEVILGAALLLGVRLRETAFLSGVLLLAFAFGMILGSGPKAPLDYSVFTAAAGAFLLSAVSAGNRAP